MRTHKFSGSIWPALWLTLATTYLPARVVSDLKEARPGDAIQMRDYQFPVVGMAGGYPVYLIGDIPICAVSPTFTQTELQPGNSQPTTKIWPRKSWEIKSNHFGVCAPQLPASPKNEEYVLVPFHLIDGDHATDWAGNGQSLPTGGDVWVRVDLAVETTIKAVNIVACDEGSGAGGTTYGMGSHNPHGMPVDFEIQVATDAWTWQTVHSIKGQPVPTPNEKLVYEFAPRRVKQIRLKCNKLRSPAKNTAWPHYAASLAEIEVINDRGENVALASRGGVVFASSTSYGFQCKPETREKYFPLIYDLGATWYRPGYWNDTISWYFVEREKGNFELDPVSRKYLDQAIDYGVNLAITLQGTPNHYYPVVTAPWGSDFYSVTAVYRRPRVKHDPDYEQAGEEGIRGWEAYCRYLAETFKGRVKHWEVLNEFLNPLNPPFMSKDGKSVNGKWVDLYMEYVKTASAALKSVDPENKVVFATVTVSLAFLEACLERGISEHADVVAWHPYHQTKGPEEFIREFGRAWVDRYPEVNTYADSVRTLRRVALAGGLSGELMANESWWGADYPNPRPDGGRAFPRLMSVRTELQKAKFTARTLVMHAGLDAKFLWCEMFENSQPTSDVGLIKNGPSSPIDSPMTTQAAYYVFRTLCTLMDGAQPTELKIKLSNASKPVDSYGFKVGDKEYLVGLWQPALDPDDDFPSITTDVTIAGLEAARVNLEDSMNGVSQPAQFKVTQHGTHLPGVVVPDWPVLIRVRAQ